MKEKRQSQTEPLFIDFLNSPLTKEFITAFLLRLEAIFTDPSDKLAAKDFREELKDHHLSGYKLIQIKFKDQVDHVITHQAFDKSFPTWANFYLSSLKEVKREKNGEMERFVHIGDPNGDWITGLILYNFSLFYKYYDKATLKKCSCGIYFTKKGKYATYCSDICKDRFGKSKSPEAQPEK